MRTVVSMNSQGRLTVPVAARQALRIEGVTQFEVEVAENALILRPVVLIPREDAWAYSPEHVERVERARGQLREGMTRQMAPDELQHLATERQA